VRPIAYFTLVCKEQSVGALMSLAACSQLPWPLTIVAGMTCLFFGWKLYLILVAGSWFLLAYALQGDIVGYVSQLHMSLPFSLSLVGPIVAVAVAIIAVFWARFAIFLLGGIGGLALANQIAPMMPTEQARVILMIVAFVVLGGLTVLLFRPFVVIASALCGAALVMLRDSQYPFGGLRSWNL